MIDDRTIRLDNTALSMWQRCPASYELRILQHLAGTGRNPILIYGAAVHEGLAAWYRTNSLDAALNAVSGYYANNPLGMLEDDWRNEAAALTLIRAYVRQYPIEHWEFVRHPDGQPFIEQPFAIDTGRVTARGRNIIYGGIFDGLVEQHGQTYILEHKTTATTPGSLYFAQFHPNNQISGYVWAASQLRGRRVQGAIINALAQQRSRSPTFARTITTRTQYEEEEWLDDLEQHANAIEHQYVLDRFPKSTSSCTLYGRPCQYHHLHQLGNPADQQRLIESIPRSVWDFEHVER